MTGFEKLGIGPDKPPKIILDFCWNHEGSIGRVRQMLEALQRTLYTEVGDRSLIDLIIPKFQAGRDLPWDRAMYRGVKRMCEEEFGLPFLCTAFDYKAVDMLVSIGVDAIKIGSAEAIDKDFVFYASERKSLIISVGGMAQRDYHGLVSSSLHGNATPIFMHCVSQYPPRAEDLSLRIVGRDFGLFFGYSSHYPYTQDAFFAIALGAQVIEKHYSDRFYRGEDQPGAGTDFAVSIGPHDAAEICKASLLWHKMRATAKSPETLAAERALLKPFRERFYAGNNHQAHQDKGQDQVPSGDARRDDSELT
jgi:sialic acid synthase SpsE